MKKLFSLVVDIGGGEFALLMLDGSIKFVPYSEIDINDLEEL